jgi:hypothetical protein
MRAWRTYGFGEVDKGSLALQVTYQEYFDYAIVSKYSQCSLTKVEFTANVVTVGAR